MSSGVFDRDRGGAPGPVRDVPADRTAHADGAKQPTLSWVRGLSRWKVRRGAMAVILLFVGALASARSRAAESRRHATPSLVQLAFAGPLMLNLEEGSVAGEAAGIPYIFTQGQFVRRFEHPNLGTAYRPIDPPIGSTTRSLAHPWRIFRQDEERFFVTGFGDVFVARQYEGRRAFIRATAPRELLRDPKFKSWLEGASWVQQQANDRGGRL